MNPSTAWGWCRRGFKSKANILAQRRRGAEKDRNRSPLNFDRALVKTGFSPRVNFLEKLFTLRLGASAGE